RLVFATIFSLARGGVPLRTPPSCIARPEEHPTSRVTGLRTPRDDLMSVATVEGARVIHALPGRIRVHFPGWSGHGQWKVERRVRGLPGVRHVEANGLTGNVLIRFDPAASDEQTLLAAVADAAKD